VPIPATKGSVYVEVTLITEGGMSLGVFWDDPSGFASVTYDGTQAAINYEGDVTPLSEKALWSAGMVLGLLFDLAAGTLTFLLNGADIGSWTCPEGTLTIFQERWSQGVYVGGIFPQNQAAEFNVGFSDFRFPPKSGTVSLRQAGEVRNWIPVPSSRVHVYDVVAVASSCQDAGLTPPLTFETWKKEGSRWQLVTSEMSLTENLLPPEVNEVGDSLESQELHASVATCKPNMGRRTRRG
jgi:hypothetical protein